jgi:hypothetical protein
VTALLAHAAPISYRFPIPVYAYAVAAGAVVLLSAPAAALAVGRRERPRKVGRDVYPTLRRLRLGAIGIGLCLFFLVFILIGGVAALVESAEQPREFFENPATVLIWVDFWVLLGMGSALVGNGWDVISPLNIAARWVSGRRERGGASFVRYPRALGQWPAVALVLTWSWMELVWDQAKQPHVLVFVLLLYALATLIGSVIFGARAWLANVELFTVFARIFSRCAPLQHDPPVPEDWLALPRERRAVRLRPYCSALEDERPSIAGSGAFVVALLATVVFDGFSQTARFHELARWFARTGPHFLQGPQAFETTLMLSIVAAFVALFLLAMWLVGLREDGLVRTAARYAPTLVPIAAVYFIAHYWTYLAFAGQDTPAVIVDPLGHSWNPWGWGEYALNTTFISGGVVWWSQIILIVAGHVMAVIAAHRVALRYHGNARRALRVQMPVVMLMVAYTVAGLWVLAQQLGPKG